MIPTQTSQATIPPVAWDGAASGRTEGRLEVVSPVTTSGRSEQICTRCGRSGTGMTTIEVGGHRWRYCGHCSGRADKTTVRRPVACSHPFLRTALDGDGYACIDCFETCPGPPLVAEDLEQGHAALSLVIPAALLGGLLALAAASGKLRYLADHLPLPEPGPTGWALFVLAMGVIGLRRRLARVRRATRGLDVLLHNERPDPWFGSAVYDPGKGHVPRRRSHPAVTHEDLAPDPDQAALGILPMQPDRRSS